MNASFGTKPQRQAIPGSGLLTVGWKMFTSNYPEGSSWLKNSFLHRIRFPVDIPKAEIGVAIKGPSEAVAPHFPNSLNVITEGGKVKFTLKGKTGFGSVGPTFCSRSQMRATALSYACFWNRKQSGGPSSSAGKCIRLRILIENSGISSHTVRLIKGYYSHAGELWPLSWVTWGKKLSHGEAEWAGGSGLPVRRVIVKHCLVMLALPLAE